MLPPSLLACPAAGALAVGCCSLTLEVRPVTEPNMREKRLTLLARTVRSLSGSCDCSVRLLLTVELVAVRLAKESCGTRVELLLATPGGSCGRWAAEPRV